MRGIVLYFFGFVLLTTALPANAAYDLNVTRVVFSPSEEKYTPGQVVYLFLDVVNSQEAPFRNVPVEVSADGRGVYSGVVNLNGSKTETIKIPSSIFDRDWEPYECGIREFTVILGESETKADFRIRGKKFMDITVSPEKINPGNSTEIKVLDEDGAGRPGIKFRLTKRSEDYDTVSNGVGLARFILGNEFKDPFGKYDVSIWALGYCIETLSIEAQEERLLKILLDPENPRPGEPTQVKVLDDKNKPVSYAYVSFEGANIPKAEYYTGGDGVVYVTVNSAGAYKVSSEKEGYPKAVREIVVSEIPTLTIKLSKPEAVVGSDYGITVSGGGVVLEDVNVSISSLNETFYYANGSILFNPPYPSDYTVAARRKFYAPAEAYFRAYNLFDMEVVQVFTDKREIMLKVSDQTKNPVSYAKVSVENTTTHGLTDKDGFVYFSIPLYDTLTFKAEKDGFKEKTFTFTPNRTLYLQANAKTIEAGDKLTLYARNEFGDSVISELTVTYPDGSRERFVKDRHVLTPDAVGEYLVSAISEGYSPTTLSFTVKPRALDLSVNESKGNLLVKAESRGAPVAGLYVWVDTPEGRDYVITNSKGVAVFKTSEEGIYVVYADSAPYEYTRKSVYVKNETILANKVIWVVAALGVLPLAAYIIHLERKRRGKRGGRDYPAEQTQYTGP
jgi:hypothetical protein